MIKYGLISDVDARCLEKTIDLICDEFQDAIIYVTEIGVYAGGTGSGIFKYLWNIKSRNVEICGIDNNKDGEEFKYFGDYANVIMGDSHEVYKQLEDKSQHLIFVDGNHTVFHVIGDFHCYEGKVKKGGYMAFHDTGAHIKPFKDYQGSGSRDDPDNYIGVRRALGIMGLLSNECEGWELVFDESDTNDEAGGICVFKKLE